RSQCAPSRRSGRASRVGTESANQSGKKQVYLVRHSVHRAGDLVYLVGSAGEPRPTVEKQKARPSQQFQSSELRNSTKKSSDQIVATTSISTSASFGRRATCTVERAGGALVKNRP